MIQKEDEDIINLVRQGDQKQFEVLFRSTYARLVQYARIIIKDLDSSEEIVQGLFVRLWNDREKIKISSTLSGYLFKAVYNRCIHYIRHRDVVEKHKENISADVTQRNDDPLEILSYKELQDKIADVMARLPIRCGKIFYMNRFEELKYYDIASQLNISVKTVEAEMSKALKVFRKEFKIL